MRPEDVATNNKGEPIQTPTNIPTIYPISNPFVSPIIIYIGLRYSWQQSLPKPYETLIPLENQIQSIPSPKKLRVKQFFILSKSGFIHDSDMKLLHSVHPLIAHFDSSRRQLENFNFTWLHQIDTKWATHQRLENKKSTSNVGLSLPL